MKAKICVVGEGGVGKTSLIRRFAYDQFDDRYLKTVGTKVTKVPLTVPHGPDLEVEVDLVLFDIMGQKGFRDMVKDTFFIGAQAVLAVCDVTNPDSLHALPEWVAVATEMAGPVPVFLVANKVDLGKETRVTEADLRAFADAHNAPAVPTSAKTRAGVEEAFNLLAVEVVDRAMKEQVVRRREDDLYGRMLQAFQRRGPLGLNKREVLEAFKGIAYQTLESELLRLERDACVQVNWLGPDDFRAMITPMGADALRPGSVGAKPSLPEVVF